jgi:hypothetical protein
VHYAYAGEQPNTIHAHGANNLGVTLRPVFIWAKISQFSWPNLFCNEDGSKTIDQTTNKRTTRAHNARVASQH